MDDAGIYFRMARSGARSDAPACNKGCAFNETIGGIAFTPDGRTAYVSDTAAQASGVFPIDVTTGRVGPMIRDGGATGPLAITPDGRTAYIDGIGTVTPIDLASNTGRRAIRVSPAAPFSTMAITPDGHTLVGMQYAAIDLVDLANGKAGAALPNPHNAFYIAMAPDATSHGSSTR